MLLKDQSTVILKCENSMNPYSFINSRQWYQRCHLSYYVCLMAKTVWLSSVQNISVLFFYIYIYHTIHQTIPFVYFDCSALLNQKVSLRSRSLSQARPEIHKNTHTQYHNKNNWFHIYVYEGKYFWAVWDQRRPDAGPLDWLTVNMLLCLFIGFGR